MAVLYIRVPDELHDKLTEVAKQYGRSLTQVATRGLEAYLIAEFGWQPAVPADLP